MTGFFPALINASNKVSILMTGFSYARIPCTEGCAPVYMVPKHTGVTDGITVQKGTSSSAHSTAGSRRDAYFLKTHSAMASGSYIKILSAFFPANLLSTYPVNCGEASAAHSGASIPIVYAKEAQSVSND